MSLLSSETVAHWTTIAPILSIRNEREYDRAVRRLNELVDEVGDDRAPSALWLARHAGDGDPCL